MGKSNINDSENKNESHANGKKGTGKTIAIIAAVFGVIIIFALVAIIVILLGRTEAPTVVTGERSQSRGVLVTPENVEEIRAGLDAPVEDGYYESKMNVDWVFETAKTPSENAYVENPPSNTRTVYFDLTLADTGELVYSSPYIPVGGVLTGFALDSDLAAGTYSAVVTYHLVDDDYNELTTVSVSVKLRVEK